MKFIPELLNECMTIIISHHTDSFKAKMEAKGIEITKELSDKFFRINQEKMNAEAVRLYPMMYKELKNKAS